MAWACVTTLRVVLIGGCHNIPHIHMPDTITELANLSDIHPVPAILRLPVCESQVLILKELQRADTVAYFRTDVNNPLARFVLVTGSEAPHATRDGRAGDSREGRLQTLQHTRMMLPKGGGKPYSSCPIDAKKGMARCGGVTYTGRSRTHWECW